MAGTAVTPVPTVGFNGGGGASNSFDPSKVNSFRISAVIDRLSIHVRGSVNNDITEFLNLCLSLARGIDFTIANHEVPSRGQELPSLLKQVCQCKNDALLQSPIMVLMVSVKRLFVVQTHSIMISSCLTSPSKVNFLLNGKGVERRTNVSMDTGPQIPTDVTHMLKFGSNLLQAVGEFNGNYVIAVSFVSDMPNPDSSDLQDYEQHAPATVNSGHSCKHIQCFDFENYVDINSRRPSWCYPHCNQHVCFSDIRIDQKMFKVLKDVGTNITKVIVASDGSWKVAMEIADATQKPVDKTSNIGQDESPQPESVGLSNAPVDVLDLTHTDDTINSVVTHKTEDKRLSLTSCQRQSMTPTMVVNPQRRQMMLTKAVLTSRMTFGLVFICQPWEWGHQMFQRKRLLAFLLPLQIRLHRLLF